MLHRNLVFTALAALSACEAQSRTGQATHPDAALDRGWDASGGSQSAFDAEPGPDSIPPARDTVDTFVDGATGVFHGRVTRVAGDVAEFDAVGVHWRITRDKYEVAAVEGFGTTPAGSLTVFSKPSRCEAFDENGTYLPNTTMGQCTSTERTLLSEGSHVVGFTQGLIVMNAVVVDETGHVDGSAIRPPLADHSLAAVWNRVAVRWAETRR